MPVTIRRDPFPEGSGSPKPPAPRPPRQRRRPTDGLRIPQARVLKTLVPPDPAVCELLWPTFTRAVLGRRAGYTELSGTLNRALRGIPDTGSKTGDPHPGLLQLGYVVEVTLDVEGVSELCYRATPAGIAAYRAYVAACGELPPPRAAGSCTNNRYRKNSADSA